ncbi:MAG: hypothetical protein JO215_07055 [Ktedonobacteraceae bacterium]|nr:hypothetical protein [Ktedonobacteraceae bacterium]
MDQGNVISADTPQQKRPNWLLSFTGLIPVVLAIPIIILHQWTLSIIVTLASALIVITYHLSKGQGITSLDVFSVLFGVVNAVLYFGFHNTIILQHLDTTIYTILLAQVVYSLLRGRPWTEQYARRSVAAELWTTKPFHEVNRFLTMLWGVVFLACDLMSLLIPEGVWRTVLPVVLLVLLAVSTPRLVRWFSARYVVGENNVGQ